MEFTWTYKKEEPQLLRSFIKEQGISKGLLAKIKFQGGVIKVNDSVQNVLYQLRPQDIVSVTIPDEVGHETLIGENTPLDIVFEDEHLLVVNKPTNIASIPAQYHPNGTMAHRVKGYYQRQGYADQVVHVVTRLDRDTTGLMMFAKHGYAHAMMDQQLRKGQVKKYYQALVAQSPEKQLPKAGRIDLPIMREETSIIKRKTGVGGLYSLTEYQRLESSHDYALVTIRLHTGRTHQIRVHFAAIGHALLGDDLYGGSLDQGIKRQALHCSELIFNHPFTKDMIRLHQKLPNDMIKVMRH